MITNNFTERLNRTIEANYNRIQTVVHFVKRLYEVKLKWENLTENIKQFQFKGKILFYLIVYNYFLYNTNIINYI